MCTCGVHLRRRRNNDDTVGLWWGSRVIRTNGVLNASFKNPLRRPNTGKTGRRWAADYLMIVAGEESVLGRLRLAAFRSREDWTAFFTLFSIVRYPGGVMCPSSADSTTRPPPFLYGRPHFHSPPPLNKRGPQEMAWHFYFHRLHKSFNGWTPKLVHRIMMNIIQHNGYHINKQFRFVVTVLLSAWPYHLITCLHSKY